MIIDLRSDTVTRPTPEMLEYMMKARVGDDVFGEDPSVNELEQKAAAIFGMEAGLFCPSGTMTNQIAIKCHTRPMDEVLCDITAHIYNYEVGGIAFNSASSVRLLQGQQGKFTAQDVLDNIHVENIHHPVTRLVVIESTSNRGGGNYYTLEEIKAISDVCKEKKLALHLDGARIFNALTETGEDPNEYSRYFDSISICLSKSLGAPVGSVLLGKRDFIKEARRVRKAFGGGMRQAGFLAAAGIYALEHHVTRLKEDHARAQQIGNKLAALPYVEKVLPVKTNIVIFKIRDAWTVQDYMTFLAGKNIKANTFGKQMVRFVTHLEFTDEMLDELLISLEKFGA